VRWNPERGGVVCRACGSSGRPMRPVVRLSLARLARVRLEAVSRELSRGTPHAVDRELVADVARGCRDALAEVIAAHLSAPLRSLEFLAKIQPAAHESSGD
jgi:hypothetical protein